MNRYDVLAPTRFIKIQSHTTGTEWQFSVNDPVMFMVMLPDFVIYLDLDACADTDTALDGNIVEVNVYAPLLENHVIDVAGISQFFTGEHFVDSASISTSFLQSKFI